MIRLENISKSFNGNVTLPGFTFDIQDGRFYTIVGPNGCGKSTLLNILAGTLDKDGGDISYANSDGSLEVGYVWQDYRSTIFPWLSISENIAFPLKVRGLSLKEREKAVLDLIEDFGVEINLKKKIYELSGGQQQLVNILRAMITRPKLLLFDEPFSALDQYRSWQMGSMLEMMWLMHKSSVLFISHDIDEAILLADEIILMNKHGNIEKVLKNDMSHSRTKEMMMTKEHLELKNEIIEFLFNQNTWNIN